MTESVSFKTYLKRDGQEVEVRRFGVDCGVATNFMYLRSKIQAVFPSIQNDEFSVFWQDTDNDYIAIGSDEELLLALTSGISQPYKLFVNIAAENVTDRQQQTEQGAPGQPQLHPGVTCDACEQEVVGYRYKCVTCPDFDLCAACEGSGKHPEHFMLRMPFPLRTASCHPKFFRKFLGRPNKLYKYRLGNLQAPGSMFYGRRCPFPRPEERERNASGSGVSDMFDFSALMEFIDSLIGSHDGQANEPAAHAEASASSQATAGQQSAGQQTAGQQAGTQEPPRPPPRQTGAADYLNGIGQAISAILDPFGVDVSFEVRPPTSQPEGTRATSQQTASTADASVSTNSNIPNSSKQNGPTTSSVSTQSQQNVPGPSQQSFTASPQQTVPAPSQQNAPTPPQQIVLSPVAISRESSPITESRSTPGRDTTPIVARRNSDDWTMITRVPSTFTDKEMEVDVAQAVPTTAPTAPPASQSPAPSVDPDRQRIQEAINNIRSMGFNYETRLLRELLRQQNGDIASVLETILNNTGKN